MRTKPQESKGPNHKVLGFRIVVMRVRIFFWGGGLGEYMIIGHLDP